jgi:hypothetical protein
VKSSDKDITNTKIRIEVLHGLASIFTILEHEQEIRITGACTTNVPTEE